MSIAPGSRLGPYEVMAQIGQGGMGEVYRARDTTLHRDVALKVLPAAFAEDADRLMRFDREARTLAALNHPHVAQIYGLETSRSTKALVMELVEGPTLANVIAQRAPLPLADAVSIMRQIALALDAAHERGIVHRDLKPANVKVTDDGTVKVLDFGLAKAFDGPPHAGSDTNSPVDLSTMTSPAVTAHGVILGTAAYMSPEQARGRLVDKRADIWAFGGVFYELLTGRRPFDAASVAELLVAVLSKEPDWSALPVSVPAHLGRLIRRCLEKDPKRRLRDIGDAVADLESGAESGTVGPSTAEPARPRWRGSWIAAAAAGGLILGAALATAWVGRSPRPIAAGPQWVGDILIDPSAPVALDQRATALGYSSQVVAMSPNGERLIYVSRTASGTILRMRDMAGGDEQTLAGTEEAVSAAFSPDGAAVAFIADNRVKRLDLAGGSPVALCEARTSVLVWWPDADTIYFTEDETWTLSRVSARSSGTNQPAVKGTPPRIVSFTDVLAGGRTALAVDRQGGIGGDYAEALVVDLETGGLTPLPLSGYGVRYVAPGYLVFGRSSNLFAAPFDVDALRVTGAERVIATGVAMDSFFFQVHASASANGLIAFVPGGDIAIGKLAWVNRIDRGGEVTYLPETPRLFGALRLSPDGRRIAVQVGDVQDHIYVRDDDRGYRVAADRLVGWPGWSPDGRRLVAQTRATRTQSAQFHVFPPENPSFAGGVSLPGVSLGGPNDWSKEDLLAVMLFETEWRIQFMRMDGSAVGDAFPGWFPMFSPDGDFVAYASSRGTNRTEVYIRSYPEGRVSPPFSLDGGTEPLWNRQTGELFYRNGGRWYAAKVSTDPELKWDPVRLVFDTDFIDTPGMSYAVSPDGQRLLVVKRAEPTTRDRLRVLSNWQAADR